MTHCDGLLCRRQALASSPELEVRDGTYVRTRHNWQRWVFPTSEPSPYRPSASTGSTDNGLAPPAVEGHAKRRRDPGLRSSASKPLLATLTGAPVGAAPNATARAQAEAASAAEEVSGAPAARGDAGGGAVVKVKAQEKAAAPMSSAPLTPDPVTDCARKGLGGSAQARAPCPRHGRQQRGRCILPP